MDVYLYPLKTAALIFPLIALVISLPFLIRQYYKYGGFSFWRALIIYSFIFYLLCSYLLVILPLPSQANVSQLTTAKTQLMPLRFLVDFVQHTAFSLTNPHTYITALKQGVFIQPLFNLMLLLPLGVYLRFYFKRSLLFIIITAFCVSLFFEVTQLSGLYGYYDRSYRLFDVDDLLLNTVGGWIGYALAPLLTFFIPSDETLRNNAYSRSHQVSYLRRLMAFLIDWLLIGIIGEFMMIKNHSLFSGTVLYQFSWLNTASYILTIVVFFIMIPYIFNGRTLGKLIVHLKIVDDLDQSPSLPQYFIRYGLLYGVVFTLINVEFNLLELTGTSDNLNLLNYLIYIVFFFILVFVVHLLINKLRKNAPLFYEKISYTHMMSSFSLFRKKNDT